MLASRDIVAFLHGPFASAQTLQDDFLSLFDLIIPILPLPMDVTHYCSIAWILRYDIVGADQTGGRAVEFLTSCFLKLGISV